MNLTLSMKRYDMNLREWMEQNKHKKRSKDRLFILHELLIGLVEIHSRGLVHGDIKPGNILVNDGMNYPLEVVLGDLGFLSLSRYAKIKYTARVYRDSEQHQSYAHDIYSLGILCLELFGFLRIRKPMTTKELKKLIDARIQETSLRSAIRKMINSTPTNRPTANKLLYELFQERVESKTFILPKVKDSSFCSKAYANMRELGTKYNLAKIDKCIESMNYYIQTHNINKKDCLPYGMCMLLISSSIYRISKFSLSKALKYSDMKIDKFLKYYCEILANDDIIKILLSGN
jgi:serine/threonine protein kinase